MHTKGVDLYQVFFMGPQGILFELNEFGERLMWYVCAYFYICAVF